MYEITSLSELLVMALSNEAKLRELGQELVDIRTAIQNGQLDKESASEKMASWQKRFAAAVSQQDQIDMTHRDLPRVPPPSPQS